MMAESFFAILGVACDASPDEIKSAYRRLAKQFHPDRCAGGGSRFRQIQEAYDTLSDDRRRHEYQQALHARRARTSVPISGIRPSEFDVRPRRYYKAQPEPLVPDAEPIGVARSGGRSSFLDEILDSLGAAFGIAGRGRARKAYEASRDLEIEVPLSRFQADAGGSVRVMVPARTVCQECRGSGLSVYGICFQCSGEGELLGRAPVDIVFPAGLSKDRAVRISLKPYGFGDIDLMVILRPARTA